MPLPNDMLAIEISKPGGPEVLTPVRLPLPDYGPMEVLIHVAAAGINAPDLGHRRGTYRPPPGASPLPGLEVSGEIAAVGSDVRGLRPGDSVVALCNGGGYAEYAAVPAGQVLPLPHNWSLLSGATLPETFFTITQTLVMRAGLSAGMDVLIHGAAGGIGVAAIQISRVLGARPIAVVSSDEKAAYVRDYGADAVILHSREDYVARTLELTGGKGADRILDMAGGEMLVRDIEAAARGGHIVLVASLSGEPSAVSAGKIVMKQLTISGSTLRPQPADTKAAIAQRLHHDFWPALEDGRVRPPRTRMLRLEDAARGHVEMERRDNYGKLILLTGFGCTQAQAAPTPDNPIESL
jgi:NADPH:quinone reductase